MGWVMMSERELGRIEVLSLVVEGSMNATTVASVLTVSTWHIRRIIKRFREGRGLFVAVAQTAPNFPPASTPARTHRRIEPDRRVVSSLVRDTRESPLFPDGLKRPRHLLQTRRAK